MKKLVRVGFIASALLVSSSFADFGANLVYQTNGGTNYYDRLVNVNSNSLIYNVSNSVNLYNLSNSTSNTLLTASNLNGIDILNASLDFLVKDYLNYDSGYIYNIYHYDINGNKLKEFLNIKNPVTKAGFDNNGNILTYSNNTQLYDGNITSIAPNGVENFVAELNGNVNYLVNFSADKSKIFTNVHYINSSSIYKLYAIDNSNGAILFEQNISGSYINIADDNNNLYIMDGGDIISLDINNGNLNWSYTSNGYIQSFKLSEDNQTVITAINDTNYTMSLVDTSSGSTKCEVNFVGFNIDSITEDKNTNLIITTLIDYINGQYINKLAFIDQTNCNVVHEETYYVNNYSNRYHYVDINTTTPNSINYIPILKDGNTTENAKFIRFNPDGSILSETDVGTATICETKSTRTKENNFYFFTDSKVTAINEAGSTISGVNVTDTTNCYYRNIVAGDDKFALKTGDGSLRVYELATTSSGIPEIPTDDDGSIILDDYSDIIVDNDNSTTDPSTSDSSVSTLILGTATSTTTNKNTLINLNLIKDNVTNVRLSANDSSVNFDVTSDSISVTFTQSGTFNVGVYALDLNGSYIESNLTFEVINRAPISLNDTITLNSNETLTLNKAQYFYDADGDSLLLSVENHPSVGRVVLSGDKIIYKPESSTYSTSFDIKATDTDGNSTIATFTINTIYQATDTASVNYGWNLLGNSFADKTLNSNDIVDTDEIVWIFENNTWTSSQYSNIEIKAQQGFWFFANSAKNLTLSATENTLVFTPASSGWSLMAPTADSKLSQLHFGYNKIYTYANSSWIEGTSNPNYELQKFKGYWGRK